MHEEHPRAGDGISGRQTMTLSLSHGLKFASGISRRLTARIAKLYRDKNAPSPRTKGWIYYLRTFWRPDRPKNQRGCFSYSMQIRSAGPWWVELLGHQVEWGKLTTSCFGCGLCHVCNTNAIDAGRMLWLLRDFSNRWCRWFSALLRHGFARLPMLTYNAGCNETLRAGSYQRGVPLIKTLRGPMVAWNEREINCSKRKKYAMMSQLSIKRTARTSFYRQATNMYPPHQRQASQDDHPAKIA